MRISSEKLAPGHIESGRSIVLTQPTLKSQTGKIHDPESFNLAIENLWIICLKGFFDRVIDRDYGWLQLY